MGNPLSKNQQVMGSAIAKNQTFTYLYGHQTLRQGVAGGACHGHVGEPVSSMEGVRPRDGMVLIGGISGGYSAYKNDTDVWAVIAVGATAGLVAGGAVDLAVAATVATRGALVVIGAGVMAGAIFGGVGAIAGDVIGQVVEQRSVQNTIVKTDNFLDRAIDGAISGSVSGLTGGVVGTLGKAATASTKAVQSTMSKNITTTATTLTKEGASQGTVNGAINSISKGMGTAGKNTTNTMLSVEAGVAASTESTIKVTDYYLFKQGD